MFKGKKGAALARDLGKRSMKTFVPGAGLPEKKAAGAAAAGGAPPGGPPKPDVEAIKVKL